MLRFTSFLYFLLYTTVFTSCIFGAFYFLFPDTFHEEYYLEAQLGQNYSEFITQDVSHTHGGNTHSHDISPEELKERIDELLYEKYARQYEELQKQKVKIHYIPPDLAEKLEYSYTPLVENFLYFRKNLAHIQSLNLFLYIYEGETRGRMKGGNIYMYDILDLGDEEFLSVLIHEFAHYYDIYSFSKTAFGDVSDRFYEISWKSTEIKYKNALISDFVSGYAMTNKYEDFAESYTYYVLHNKDFESKAQDNPVLQRKYDFFSRYVFPERQFINTDFSDAEVKEYYWDITKISLDIKKFLQYLDDSYNDA